ncbi:hypothetical protein, partial [uncultured Nocardioides sp.]|uniref:hypothetical protein n=1 Tax=uncultured Nocardioides sp. TaxID=198441 RepID=UPI002609BF99
YPADGGARVQFAAVGGPAFIDQDSAGNILVADRSSKNLLAIAPDGAKTILSSGFLNPVSVAQRPDGSYV